MDSIPIHVQRPGGKNAQQNDVFIRYHKIIVLQQAGCMKKNRQFAKTANAAKVWRNAAWNSESKLDEVALKQEDQYEMRANRKVTDSDLYEMYRISRTSRQVQAVLYQIRWVKGQNWVRKAIEEQGRQTKVR